MNPLYIFKFFYDEDISFQVFRYSSLRLPWLSFLEILLTIACIFCQSNQSGNCWVQIVRLGQMQSYSRTEVHFLN